jgi:AAA15 family ATPase/GTPase
MININPFIKNISVSNFKVLNEVTIDDLSLINIISGPNNSGKTTLLQAIFYLMNHYNPQALLDLFSQSGMLVPLKYFSYLFNHNEQKDGLQFRVKANTNLKTIDTTFQLKEDNRKNRQILENKKIDITHQLLFILYEEMIIENNSLIEEEMFTKYSIVQDIEYKLSIEIERTAFNILPRCQLISNPNPKYNILDLPNILSTLKLQENKSDYIKLINIINPHILELETIVQGSIVNVYAHINKKMIPIQNIGGGSFILFILCFAIMQAKNGICLIEHFEHEIYYKTLPEIWKLLCLLAKENNCQLFLTSHSLENLKSALIGVKDADCIDYFRYIRLARNSKENKNYVNIDNYKQLSKTIEAEFDPR